MIFRLLILVVITGIAFLAWNFLEARKTNLPLETELLSIEQDSITALELQGSKDTHPILLKKENGNWVGNIDRISFLAIQSLVDSLLTPVDQIYSRDLFIPDQDSKVLKQISLRYYNQGQLLQAFSLLKYQDYPQKTFLKFSKEGEVFEIEDQIWTYFDRPAEKYRVKDFIEFPPEEVSEIGFSFEPNVLVSLVRDSSGWSGGAGELSWVNDWLQNISKLDGERHADQFDQIAASELLNCSIDIRFVDQRTPLQIYVYQDSSAVSEFIVHASQFPNQFFYSDSLGLYRKLVPVAFRESVNPE